MSKTELSQIVLSVHYILIIKYSDKIYLLHSAVLEKTNNKIVKFIYESLELWPAEIKHEKVLLFISDSALYIKKAAKKLYYIS